MSTPVSSTQWLEKFLEGDRQVLEECYREHFQAVSRAVGQILGGADQETVIHEVFFRLISNREFRNHFQGGTLGAWLSVVARNQARDFLRHQRREQLVDPEEARTLLEKEQTGDDRRLEARLLLDRLREECLPEKWHAVFEACFLMQLSQREAAARLGIRRTTLAYQMSRIQLRLRRFLARWEEP